MHNCSDSLIHSKVLRCPHVPRAFLLATVAKNAMECDVGQKEGEILATVFCWFLLMIVMKQHT